MSTMVRMGMLKASQKRTKRAPFCEAGMSRVPARDRGWLATTPDGHAADARQRRHQLGGPHGAQLEQLAVVGHGVDDVADVVGGGARSRDHARGALGTDRSGGSSLGRRRRLGVGVVGKVPEHGADEVEDVGLVGGHEGAEAAGRGVHGRAAEIVQRHPDAGETLHGVGARQEGEGVGGHHRQVGQAEQQRRARDGRAGDGGQHRDPARAGDDGRRRLPPAVQGADPFGRRPIPRTT